MEGRGRGGKKLAQDQGAKGEGRSAGQQGQKGHNKGHVAALQATVFTFATHAGTQRAHANIPCTHADTPCRHLMHTNYLACGGCQADDCLQGASSHWQGPVTAHAAQLSVVPATWRDRGSIWLVGKRRFKLSVSSSVSYLQKEIRDQLG